MTLAYKSGQTVFRRRLNSIPTFAFNLDQASNKKEKKTGQSSDPVPHFSITFSASFRFFFFLLIHLSLCLPRK